jgi:hypothetical protein
VPHSQSLSPTVEIDVGPSNQKVQELIEAEMAHSGWDEMRVAALKKEKLRLKDELQRLELYVLHNLDNAK